MKPFVALYKAYTGGEWFEASLESIRANTDGAVVVFSDRPWLASLPLENDCREPLARFMARHPDYPIHTRHIDSREQTDQYRLGLDTVKAQFGDAHVLVIDTDEVWSPADVQALRECIDAHPQADLFLAGIRTYLRSPLYQVWPQEPIACTVALRSPVVPKVGGRIRAWSGATSQAAPVAFDHYPYVRRDERALRAKFLNTGSQESHPSDYAWFDRVWDRLPDGGDLHMTVGYEYCWKGVRVLPPTRLPVESAFAREAVAAEDSRWRERLRGEAPGETLVPVPTDPDADTYADLFARYVEGREYAELLAVMKNTVLEALLLADWAADVPAGGTILEIGSGTGGSMACLALGSDDSIDLISVDPFSAYDEHTHAGVVKDVHEGNESEFWRTADTFGYRTRTRNLKLNSDEAASHVPDASCDLLFVDGNHSRDIVADDLRLYWAKVKPGGLLIGHDYTTRFPGVIEATDAWEREAGVSVTVHQGTSLFSVRKA